MPGQSVQIRDGDASATVDILAAALTIADVRHIRVHQGRSFSAQFVDLAVIATTGTLELLLRVASPTFPHVRFKIAAGAEGRFQFFQAPTTSADGAAVPRINRDRTSAANSVTLVFSGPTVSADGTPLIDRVIPVGGELESSEELILTNADYLLKVSNLNAGAQAISAQIDFYE